jgi:hypothetical protein
MRIVPVFAALGGFIVTSHSSSFSNASLKRLYDAGILFHVDLINLFKAAGGSKCEYILHKLRCTSLN